MEEFTKVPKPQPAGNDSKPAGTPPTPSKGFDMVRPAAKPAATAGQPHPHEGAATTPSSSTPPHASHATTTTSTSSKDSNVFDRLMDDADSKTAATDTTAPTSSTRGRFLGRKDKAGKKDQQDKGEGKDSTAGSLKARASAVTGSLTGKLKKGKKDRAAASGISSTTPGSSKKQPSRKKLITYLLIAAAVLIVLAAGLFIWKKVTAPVNITKIETLRSLSSRVKDAPVQTTFKSTDPIMVHFTYKDAKTGTVVKYEVTDKDNKVVRSGETVALKAEDNSQDSGQRYISIVNTPNTKLDAGQYTIKLKVDGSTVKTARFGVE